MISLLRIRTIPQAKPEQPEEPSPYPIINGLVPTLMDLEVMGVDERTGVETQLRSISKIEIIAEKDEPIRARVEFLNVEIDVQAIAEEG